MTSRPGLVARRSGSTDTSPKWTPDVSIFVFKDSFGSDASLGRTGTEEEWRNAIDTLSTHPGFDIGLYSARRRQCTRRSGMRKIRKRA